VIDDVRATSRDALLLSSHPRSNHRIPFVANFCPQLPRFNEIFSKFICLLSDDICMKELFPDKPVIAYRRAPTFKDILVNSFLKSISPGPHSKHFSTAKGRAAPLTHTQLLAIPFTHTTATLHTILGHANCNTTNIIYIATCTKCHKQYIGETGRKLKTRVSEHIRLHNSLGYRKVEELFWINKLDTIGFDLNKKDHQ